MDSETGLYYFGARYYDGRAGRFVSLDPAYLAVGDNRQLKQKTRLDLKTYLANPQQLNSYSYTINNPLKYVDNNGEWLDIVIDAGFIGYDLYKLGTAIFTGGDVRGEVASLGLDIGSAAIPGVVGLGVAARVARVADKAVDVGKIMNRSEKLLGAPISITEKRLEHAINRHTYSGVKYTDNPSKFNKGENIVELIKSGNHQPSVLQKNGNFQRTFDAGRNIGIDRATGKQTPVITIITDKFNNLITSFPGKP